MRCRTILRPVLGAVAVLAVASPRTEAAKPDPTVVCQSGIAKASNVFARVKLAALQMCEDKKIAGKLPATTDCLTEPKTATKIQKALAALSLGVVKACGGKDKTCEVGGDDQPLAAIGWNVPKCPGLEDGTCANPIATCSDIATCLGCVGEKAVDQAIALYYGHLSQAAFGQNKLPLTKCQRAIGRESAKFFTAKSKALVACWQKRLKGKHSNPCPDPGDGKALPAIQKAEAKKVAAICKACGGKDKVCGGTDDISPASIGFVSQCSNLTVPAGPSCAKTISSLQDVVDCVDCVSEFKADCVDRIAVPLLASYPSECQGPQGPVCGNHIVEAGETCDDGNTVNGDACPSNCVIQSCNAISGTDRPVSVRFSVPPGSPVVEGITVLVDYPEGKVSIPGSGGSIPAGIITDLPGTGVPNDLDYALLEGIVSGSPIAPGKIFTIHFQNCSGASAPAVGDFSCTVTDSSDDLGNTVPGITCSVTIP
jgi:cysteine-rich repeat protein